MDTWIIADNDQVAARIRESLRLLGLECQPARTLRVETLLPGGENVAGCDGLVLFAVRNIEFGYLEILRQIRAALHNDAKLVVVSTIRDHGTVLNTIRAGANDFLSVDDNLEEELASLVSRVRSERKQKHIEGRVISIVPCGASGDASLLASNLAGAIAKQGKSCALLDFHLRGGDLALLLKLTPRHTMFDLLNQQASIDEAMFEQALTRHDSGIRLLAGPSSFVELKNVRPQVCQQIIGLAQRSHEYVIVNSEDVQHAEQVRALAGSDDIVVTIRLDIVSLHRATQHIEFMTRNRVLREHIHVVALGGGHSGELPIAGVKKVLQISTLHTIPDDPVATIRAINLGNPLVFETPQAAITNAIVSFANALLGASQQAVPVASRPPIAAAKAAAVFALNTLPFCK
jgi:Flp pilus assembly CpaE family ATPase